MKKVAIISSSYPPNIWNSQGRSAFSISFGLAKVGYTVTVICYTSRQKSFTAYDNQVEVKYIGGISKTRTLSSADVPRWNAEILKELLLDNFEAVILTDARAWEAAKKFKMCRAYEDVKIIGCAPVLYSLTGWLTTVDSKLEKEVKKREEDYLLHCDTLIAHTVRHAEKIANFSDREVHAIPNGYLDFSQNPIEYTSQKNQICYLGKLNRERNIERIIRVLPNLPEAKLVIASPELDKGYRPILERLASSLDVDMQIEYRGWLSTEECKQLYVESACAVVPSQFEPYGYRAIDPISLGTPVVVSTWSGLEEYLGSSSCVFANLDQLTDILRKLISSHEIRTIEATKNIEKLSSSYTEEATTSMLEYLL